MSSIVIERNNPTIQNGLNHHFKSHTRSNCEPEAKDFFLLINNIAGYNIKLVYVIDETLHELNLLTDFLFYSVFISNELCPLKVELNR